MPVSDIAYISGSELAKRIRNREISCSEVMHATLARSDQVQAEFNCFITIAHEQALAAAKAADTALARGEEVGPLHGIPVSVKDLVNTAGIRTTFGSLIFADNVPEKDSVSIARLKQAGAIVFAKTTTPEFGHKPLTEAPLFGRTRNAWSAERTSGGSSGGSAVAAAVGAGPLTVATDAGGSTRIPAACNGVVGFKQSLGVVPDDRMPDAFGNFSYITPTTRTVMDTALMLQAMQGADDCDPHAHWTEQDFVSAVVARGNLKGKRIAWRPHLGNDVIDSEYLALCRKAVGALEALGADVEEVPDDFAPMEPIWMVLSCVAWQARFGKYLDTHVNELSETLRRWMQEGTGYTAADLQDALYTRTTVYRQVQGWFRDYDLIVTPTLTRTAIPIDWDLFAPIEIEGKPVATMRKAWYPYTHPFNLTGHPAIALPAGMHSDGLPVSIQFVGRRGADAELLRTAALFEQAAPWDQLRPY